MLLVALLALSAAWMAHVAVCLIINIRRARRLEVPMVIIPFSPMNVLWILLEPIFLPLIEHLPFVSRRIVRYCRRGWHFHDKFQTHLELGDAWILVTPGENFLYIANPTAVQEIFHRRVDFKRPLHLYSMLDIFGPNLSTVDGPEWQRQRKIIASPFNETLNQTVWKESLIQARAMSQAWILTKASGTKTASKDLKTLTLNVLAAAGFRQSYRFNGAGEPSSDRATTYRDALSIVLDNALLMLIAPPWLLSCPIVPWSWRRIGQATQDFSRHMTIMLQEEEVAISQRKPGTNSIMSALVRASEDLRHSRKAHEVTESDSKAKAKGLTPKEVMGNIFLINFAGHDTTANAITYALMLLSIFREVQDWVAEEICEVFPRDDAKSSEYKTVFPRLKRCQCVLLETLRLYPPVMGVPKIISDGTKQQIRVNNQSLAIPSGTIILSSLLALQTHPRHWGPDSLTWRPSRWIESRTSCSEASVSLKDKLEQEQLFQPAPGTFFPWVDGPRICPGKQFAQVETVAVLAGLLRTQKLEPAVAPGEDIGVVRRRMLDMVNDSVQGLLLHIRDPTQLALVSSER